jgi:carboxypeptidase Q
MLKNLIFLALILVLTLSAEKDYTDLVKKLKSSIEDPNGIFYHSAFNRLAYISDSFGPRLWGSQTLETVIA